MGAEGLEGQEGWLGVASRGMERLRCQMQMALQYVPHRINGQAGRRAAAMHMRLEHAPTAGRLPSWIIKHPPPGIHQVVSSTLAGAALGSLAGGGVADSLGRRVSFLLAAVPMVAGPLISAAAGDINTMAAGRFLTGAAIGLSSALVPTYISEVRRREEGEGAGAGLFPPFPHVREARSTRRTRGRGCWPRAQ